ncbi:MAG: methyltransferase domain-containing protein [Verrucomicrobiae bacterium]|nr:methyltransferase domain-containing protein [Verrucomicrobiae bacterium]
MSEFHSANKSECRKREKVAARADADSPFFPSSGNGNFLTQTLEKWEMSPVGLFLREFINHPREIGAIVPSSRQLARQMASFVPVRQKGVVVDLGAGTGVVTSALLDQGVDARRVVAVERSPRLAGYFRGRFPHVKMIQGDAQLLDQLLEDQFGADYGGVDFIISSLPLRSLPRSVVKSVEQKVHQVLKKNGRFIQFTYDLRPASLWTFDRLTHCDSHMVWRNLPPARVDVFRSKQGGRLKVEG